MANDFLKKNFSLMVIAAVTVMSFLLPSVAITVSASELSSTANSDDAIEISQGVFTLNTDLLNEEEQRQLEVGEKLSELFTQDSEGNLIIGANSKELQRKLGISENEAQQLIEATNEIGQDIDVQSRRSMARGFVGLHLNLGPSTRKMNGWLAGTFVAGYVGWHLKKFAVSGVTAGAVAVISGAIGWVVKTAVERGLRFVSVGTFIPNVSLAFSVTTP